MCDYRHPVLVGVAEQTAQALDMRGIMVVDAGVCKMQFEATAQIRIFRAACQLIERVLLQWIDAAEAHQTIWKSRDLAARPVVFLPHSLVFVLRGSRWIAEYVGHRQHCRSADASGVQQRDTIRRIDGRNTLGFRDDLAEEVLMVIGERGRLGMGG